VDHLGRLRCILAVARTLPGEKTASASSASGLLPSPDQVRAALADAGLKDADAANMPHDKAGNMFMTAKGVKTRAELDRYCAGTPAWAGKPWRLRCRVLNVDEGGRHPMDLRAKAADCRE
jgi:hypothetical protein